jgi:MYXO-CTERM domain-containing protein
LDANSITFYGQYKLGQMTTWTQSGGQVDLTGALTVRTANDWQGQFDMTVEGGYGDGTNFNVGSLNLYTSPFNPATPSRLTALLDNGGIEPINVGSAGITTLRDMELGVGALGAATIGDIVGQHDFVIANGEINDANLTLVELASLTDLGGSASYAIVGNNLGGQTLQVTVTALIPEPSTFVLASLGLLGLGAFPRRRRRYSCFSREA